MKEYDEDEAIKLMSDSVAPELRDFDAVAEVLDLIYDYYDENGDLEIDGDDDEDEDVEDMTAYIMQYLKKNPPKVCFTDGDVAAMIRAEINYEQSLF